MLAVFIHFTFIIPLTAPIFYDMLTVNKIVTAASMFKSTVQQAPLLFIITFAIIDCEMNQNKQRTLKSSS